MIEQTFHGLPFLSDSFSHKTLLAAVAHSRIPQSYGQSPTHKQLQLMLDPCIATRLRIARGITASIPSRDLTFAESNLVMESGDAICARFPGWRPLLHAVPIIYRALTHSTDVSCSCYAHPQHVYLGRRALGDTEILIESHIHELCHNWMYHLEELARFHHEDSKEVFVLPSGTPNRNPSEVIGACHVSLALLRWYRVAPHHADRVRHLKRYARGCINTLKGPAKATLSVVGLEILELLSRMAEEQSVSTHQ